MGKFWEGFVVAILALLLLAHLLAAAEKQQCQLDYHVKQCVLQVIPVSDSTGEETK
jgi:hypothetical protein